MKTNTKIDPLLVPEIVGQAKQAAESAASDYFHNRLGGEDRMLCGFAWVNIRGIHGNSKLAKTLAKYDITKDYLGHLCWWNPSRFGCQNIDTLEAGAIAAAETLRKYGFDAIAQSRLD